MIKNFIEFALKRPILNHMFLAFLLLLSIFAYMKIPKEIFPISSLNSVSINGSYIGASSDILDLMAVSKIEDDLANISEIDKITSVIKSGTFNINVTIKDGYEVQDILDKVKDVITKIKKDLPSDMNEPTVSKNSVNFPLVTVSVSSNRSRAELLKIANNIKKRLSIINDLSSINIWGDSDKQLLITFNEKKIDAYGLNKTTVINVVSQLSNIFPAGNIKDSKKGIHYFLSSQNGEKDIKKIQNTILKIGDLTIYLKDIATIEYILSDASTISHFNGSKNISIGINKGRGGDGIALVKNIKKILKNEEKKYKDVTFDTYLDSSIWIKNRLNTVISNIIFGIILLAIALRFFINARIAFVVAIGIPTSFMIGLIGAEYLGYSLNMLSLLGTLLALGMLVDEAIVVSENIYRHLEMGKNKYDAALDGAYEMFPAILTATATTVFAFLPILMMTGETGMFLKVLPIMITILILSSLFEAFYFLPLHAMHSLKVDINHKKDLNNKGFLDNLQIKYVKLLSYLLDKKYIALFGMIFGIIFLTIVLLKQSKFKFMPNFDGQQVNIAGSIGPGNDINTTEAIVFKLEKKLFDNFKLGKQIESISSITGIKVTANKAVSQEFYFEIFINLKERAPHNLFDKYINPIFSLNYDLSNMTRDVPAEVIAKDIRKVLSKDIKSKIFKELNVEVPGAGIVKHDVEISFSGKDNKLVRETLLNIKKELSNIKNVKNIADDILLGNKDLKFKINRYGQTLGFTETTIVNALKPYYFKASFSKMYDQDGVVDILFQSNNKDIKDSLDNFEITIPNSNKKVNINDIVIFEEFDSLSQILKDDSTRIQTLTASLDGITSDEVYAILDKSLKKIPKGVSYKIKGEQKENKKVQMEMGQSFIIALILIFMSLVVMFDSMLKSFLILTTIPLSILGVLIGHMIMGINLTMPSVIGIIGLAGVIVNDGIIIMDFIQKAKTLEEIKEFASLRLRPIILTSFTTVLGLSTLMFFASGQALILQPMAISLGFGVLWATFLNLFYLPLIYRVIYLRKI